MMAKIVQGRGFKGIVNYVLDKNKAELLAADGLRLNGRNSIIQSFITQSTLNPIAKPVAHISLDFSAQDREKLTNSKMVEIAHEYVASGKENVNRHRLREPDATKYRIYDALVKNVPLSKSWEELQSRLRADGVEIGFKNKGSTSQIEGVRFTANNLTFNGSKVDKQFSYSKIDYALRQNAREEQQQQSPNAQVQPPKQRFEVPLHQNEGRSHPERISELENLFEINRDNTKIRQMSKDIEDYELAVKEKATLDEQTRLRQLEAEKLNHEAEKLKKR